MSQLAMSVIHHAQELGVYEEYVETTPEPLQESPVMRFLGHRANFIDAAGDAVFCPGDDPIGWDARTNAIRCALFSIQEARENGMDDSDRCRVLATLMLNGVDTFARRCGA